MKKITYEGTRLARVIISNDSEHGCTGCYFHQYSPREDGIVCKRPYQHGGVLACSEEFETGNWVQDGDDDDDGYFETREELYIWELDIPTELNKQTRTI